MKQDIAELKAELLCRGVHIDKLAHKPEFRKGGTGRAGEIYLEIGGAYVNVPVTGKFVAKSPYSLHSEGDSYSLFRDGKFVCDVILHHPIHYEKKTPHGVKKFARIHSASCFGTTIFHSCIHWRHGKACKFCGLELALEYAMPQKNPHDVAEAAEKAYKIGRASHAVLTTGTQASRLREVEMMAQTIKAIKKRVNIPVHIVIEAFEDVSLLEKLSDADTIDINIETFDPKVFQEVCPGKADLNFEMYVKNWKKAVEIFGKNQVSSWIVVGLGEDWDSTIKGLEKMTSMGVIPYLVPLRPSPNTTLADANPPEPGYLLELCEIASNLMRKYDLNLNENLGGCTVCSASSPIKEVYNKIYMMRP